MRNFAKRLLIVSLCVVVLAVSVIGITKHLGLFDEKDTMVEIPLTDLAATYKGEIKDVDGNLLVPFDVAYPEAFATGSYAYNKDVLLLKFKDNFNGKINNNLKSCGFSSIEKFVDMILSGEITDAKTQAAVLKLYTMLKRGEIKI